MRNLAIYNPIRMERNSVNYDTRNIFDFDMNSTDFLVFCRCLYVYMQTSPHRTKVTELMVQASSYMQNSILLKYEQPNDSRVTRPEELFEKFIQNIRKYCSHEHSVRFYADKLFITSQYLSRISKDVSGRVASEWINEFILIDAIALLKNTNLTIQEISDKVGFSDQSSFGKFFKKRTGVSPRKYVCETMKYK